MSHPQTHAWCHHNPFQVRHVCFRRRCGSFLFTHTRELMSSCIMTGEPKLIAQLPPPANTSCYYFIEWKTHVSYKRFDKIQLG